MKKKKNKPLTSMSKWVIRRFPMQMVDDWIPPDTVSSGFYYGGGGGGGGGGRGVCVWLFCFFFPFFFGLNF